MKSSLSSGKKGSQDNPEVRKKELMYMSHYMSLIIQKEKLLELKLTG